MQEYRSGDESIGSLVDALISKAIEQNVSDIHLEPTACELRVRFRVDGVLQEQKPFDAVVAQQIIGRIKVLSRLNITHKRVPQDGKISFVKSGQSVDLRVSTFPTIFGEKVVIRILDSSSPVIGLDQLGINPSVYAQFCSLIKKPQGFFLVTGPTGSGKTTTLYAVLSALYSPEKNMVTLEDPVEYTLPGIIQSPICPAAGFTFDHGMRSVLRQDPDIIMVGEIRDKQTAQVATQAALTGHLVLSSLHTNDAPSAVMRLMDMGIEPFLINATVTGVLAQRLARTICSSCKMSYIPSDEEKRSMEQRKITDVTVLYRGEGCVACNYSGCKGRIGIFELLELSNLFRALVVKQPDFDIMKRQAEQDGMQTLAQDGIQKVKSGKISLSEYFRAIAGNAI